MVFNNQNAYVKQQSGDEEPQGTEQINSHSSVLTNRRIDIVLQQVNVWKTQARSGIPPKMPDIQQYFSSLCTFFDETFSVLSPPEIIEIRDLFNKYWGTFVQMTASEYTHTIKNTYILLNLCNQIERSIRAGLQKYGYFIRIGSRDIKRIEDGKKILMEGGGFFGGNSRPRSSLKAKQHGLGADNYPVSSDVSAVQDKVSE